LGSLLKTLLILICLLSILGCGKPPIFHIKALAKTNIDDISEIHLNQVTALLKQLTDKLYKKNPYELKKAKGQTIKSRLNQIFACPPGKRFEELDLKSGTEAMLLGFEPEFKGDRVFALMYGLYTMIHTSYDSKCEFFMPDYLSEQDLYNSARNIEILVWRLNVRQNQDGCPIILTNSVNSEIKNLSYERLFGKLISLQDTMAKIVSNRTGRIIKEVVQFAGKSFLPIGI